MEATRAILSTAAVARMAKGLKQRQPIRNVVVVTDSKTVRSAITTYSSLLGEQANTRNLTGVSKRVSSRYESEASSGRYGKAEFADGSVYIDLKLTKDELAEGLARDAVRRMQQMRKEMDLKVDSYVHAYIVAPSEPRARLLRSKARYLAREIRAKRLAVSTRKSTMKAPFYTKTWQIDRETYEFGLCELSRLKEKSVRA
jgi:hypothetical protein